MAAVFTSIGYPGTIDPGAEWARTKQTAGGTYGVVGAGDWKVTIKPAADRTAQIAAGAGFRGGIDDTTVGVGEVTFGTLTSGTRYDLVAARSTWGSTNATSFVVIPGSSTRGLPARSSTPGTEDDQPIALARITGGVGGGTLSEIIDLRVWQANGGAVGADDLVRSYLTDVGTLVRIGSILWQRVVDNLGAAVWVQTPMTFGHGETTGPIGFPVANAQLWNLGTQTLDAAASINAPGSASGAGFQVGVTGLYAISQMVAFPGVLSGRAFVDIDVAGTRVARATLTGDSTANAVCPGVRVTAGQLISGIVYQTSGGIVNLTSSRLRVTLLRAL